MTPSVTTPDPSPAPSPAPAGGASIAGHVTVGAPAGMAATMSTGIAGVTVTVAGTNLHASTDGSGHFSLSHVPSGHVDVQFSGAANGTVSLDDVGEQESIDLEVSTQGATVEVDQEERVDGPQAQLEGRITGVAGQSFMIGSITVVVPPTTTIVHGSRTLTFADLIVGARVHVKGSKSGSTITASWIEVQQPGPGNGNGNGGGNGNSGNGSGNGNGNGDGNSGGDGSGSDVSTGGA